MGLVAKTCVETDLKELINRALLFISIKQDADVLHGDSYVLMCILLTFKRAVPLSDDYGHLFQPSYS